MGEALIVRRGGTGSFKGKQVVNIFVQLDEPTPTGVGDIWIKTDDPVSSTFFRTEEPESPSGEIGIIKIGDMLQIHTNIEESMKFLGRDIEKYTVYYPIGLIEYNPPTSGYVKIWENPYMEIRAKLGSFKLWTPSLNEWVFRIIYYWDGNKWVQTGWDNFYPHFSRSTTAKYDNEGNEIWRLSGLRAVSIDKNWDIYGVASSGSVCRISKDGEEIWRVQPLGNLINSYQSLVTEECVYVKLTSSSSEDSVRVVCLNKSDGTVNWDASQILFGNTNWISRGFITVDKFSNLYLLYGPNTSNRIAKIDMTGNIIYDVARSNDKVVEKVLSDSEGYIYVLQGRGIPGNSYVAKYNPVDGSLVWEKNLISSNSNYIYGFAISKNYGYISSYYTVRQFDLQSGDIVAEWVLDKFVVDLSVTPDGLLYCLLRTETTYSGNMTVQIDLESGDIIREINHVVSERTVASPLIGAFPHVW